MSCIFVDVRYLVLMKIKKLINCIDAAMKDWIKIL